MSIPTSGPEAPAAVRTPHSRFDGLEDYPFSAHYLNVANPYGESLQMHYLDEGPADGQVVLMVHGEPTWSYLYRNLIPVFTDAGYRAIVPDLIGFGKSDKLTRAPHYSFSQHIEWLRELVLGLDLQRIILICQDWGGPVGLGVLARERHRFAGIVAANTMLHTGEATLQGKLGWAANTLGADNASVNKHLLNWVQYSHRAPDFNASDSLPVATVTTVPAAVLAAYDAPFPSEWHKAGMRQFPLLIPVTDTDPGAAINLATWDALGTFEHPFLTLFSDSDPATSGWEKVFQERVPGAKGQPHQTLKGAGHFWQEDCGEHAARLIVNWLQHH